MAEFVEWGERIETVPESLSNPQLLALLRAAEAHPHFRVIELRLIRSPPPHVGIVVEASDGTIEPKNAAGLRTRERLFITFRPGGYVPAEVRALRADFPDVVHLNGVATGEPASLCLYENWGLEERRWTPEKHLGRILWWLRRTADGSLHAQDQALEQLFYATGHTVVLPAEFEHQKADELGTIYFEQVERPDRRLYLVASTTKPAREATVQPLMVDLSPVGNIPVQRMPGTLGELSDHLGRMGIEFQPAFDAALKRQFRHSAEGRGANGDLLLIVRIPRTRNEKVERLDCRGFLVSGKFEDVGIKLGALFRPVPGGPASVADDLRIGGTPLAPETGWRSVPIDLVDLRHMPSRDFARLISGVPDAGADFAGVLAGVGSLGSVLADIWTREGWGRWTFIDPDFIAPHNLVRHVANANAIGFPKVEFARAQVAFALGHAQDAASTAVIASANDFERSEVTTALAKARLLVDASTTIEVPRDWSEKDLPRSASVFFTYSGMSAVLILEDEARATRLAALEAQYYRAILSESWGVAHLSGADQVRVGAGCRDHSLVLPFELVKLHAAQLARRLRKAVDSEDAAISVWTLDDTSGGIEAASVPVHKVRAINLAPWQVRWDEGLETKLRAWRDVALPAETGGVLVGVIDQKLRSITIVDACDAPPDSSADATSFIRGTEGSQDYVSRCEELTGQMVSYVGEWHSHPKGHSASPSSTDVLLLATLAGRLAADGVPALIVIISESDFCVAIGNASSS